MAPRATPGLGGAGLRARLATSLTCLVVVIAAPGCPKDIPPIKLEPTLVPPTFIAVAPGQTQQSAQFLTGSTLFLKIKDARTGMRVPKAAIGIQGPTLAGGVSGATFDLSFGPLAAATYRIRVAAPGYVTRIQEVVVAPRGKAGVKTEDTRAEISLEPGGGAITGRVVADGTGNPVPGARIRAGDEIAFSGADGAYKLEGLAPGSYTLDIRKTGYTVASTSDARPGGDAGTIRLAPAGVTINIANAKTVFGTSAAGTTLSELKAALIAARATVKEEDAAGADVQIVAAPGADFASKAPELLRWVSDTGGKLVVLGEWGGLSGYSPETAEVLVHPAGISINADLVRSTRNASSADWPLAAAASPWPYPSAEVVLFGAASILAVPPAQIILRAQGGYRIAAVATQDPGVAAVAPYGAGLVAAVGDTSAWSDSNTTGAGPDLGHRDNRSYVVNLILW